MPLRALLSQDPLLAPSVKRSARPARAGRVRRIRARRARGPRAAGLREGRDHDGGPLGERLRRSRSRRPGPSSAASRPTATRMLEVGRGRHRRRSASSAAGRAASWRSPGRSRIGAWCSAYAANVEEQIERLMELPGIGPWTAQYIAMRALHWPDAFPDGDLMLLRAAGTGRKELLDARRGLAAVARLRDTSSLAHSGSSSMNSYTYVDSPIGRLLLEHRRRSAHRASTCTCPTAPRPRCTGGPAMPARVRCPRPCGSSRSISAARGATSICRCASPARNFSAGLEASDGDSLWRDLSYGELAKRIGNPNASRAVGLANGRNPIPILVPCHRVIGADGSLTGYGGGIERKRWLLAHEGLH